MHSINELKSHFYSKIFNFYCKKSKLGSFKKKCDVNYFVFIGTCVKSVTYLQLWD